MRTLISHFGRSIALFVTLAMLTSSVAMAAYVCPKAAADMSAMAMVQHSQDMDDDMPAHCAERHNGDKQALEFSSSAPALALPALILIQLLPPAALPFRLTDAVHTDAPLFPAHAPPFLRTLRLRI